MLDHFEFLRISNPDSETNKLETMPFATQVLGCPSWRWLKCSCSSSQLCSTSQLTTGVPVRRSLAHLSVHITGKISEVTLKQPGSETTMYNITKMLLMKVLFSYTGVFPCMNIRVLQAPQHHRIMLNQILVLQLDQ